MYSRQKILRFLHDGLIKVSPFNSEQVEKVHINLHLSQDLKISPKGFVVTSTMEKITLPAEISGLIDGKASLAKKGVSIHQSSMLVEPLTDNVMTLELFNASDETVKLDAGQEIAKLLLFDVI